MTNSEDVLYGRRDLEMRNEDGLSTLMYLQVDDHKIYAERVPYSAALDMLWDRCMAFMFTPGPDTISLVNSASHAFLLHRRCTSMTGATLLKG